MVTFTAEQSSAVQGELRAIVKSPCFAGSKRCQDFLDFIVRQALDGNYEYLTERFLGAELFGRSIDYDTGADSIVRVRANDVRRRLAQFYSDHHAVAGVTIHLASGSYVPEFHWPEAAAPPEVNGAGDAAALPQSPFGRAATAPAAAPAKRRLPLVLSVAVALIAGCCLGWWTRERAVDRSLYPWKYQPALDALWSGFLDNGRGTDVVLSDASFQLIQNVSKQTFALNSYLNRSYLGDLEAHDTNPAMRSILDLIASKNFGNSSEFRLTERILALGWPGNKVHIYNARDYSSSLVSQDNVVLIGSEYTNPWQHLFEGQLNFVERAGTDSYGPMVNRAPKAGERAVYVPTDDTGYCVVAFLPNPTYSTNALLIEGSSSEATEAGGDFIMSQDKLDHFMKRLKVQRLPYFEVLLKTSQAHGTPIAASVEMYRTYSTQR